MSETPEQILEERNDLRSQVGRLTPLFEERNDIIRRLRKAVEVLADALSNISAVKLGKMGVVNNAIKDAANILRPLKGKL